MMANQVSPTAGLGDLVRCLETGIEGLVTGKTLWLAGCDRVGIRQQTGGKATVGSDGKPVELWWQDVTMVVVLERQVLLPLDLTTPTTPTNAEVERALPQTGGPREDPSR